MHVLVASMALCLIQPFVIALSVLDLRQDLPGELGNDNFDPTRPPAEWVNVGCYTDTVGSPSEGFSTRTLRAQSMSSNAMTPKMCIDFCSDSSKFPPNGYKFAGMESGTECFCDNVIQPTGNLTNTLDCNSDCPGDTIFGFSPFSCGGNGFIRIYTNSTSSPAIATSVVSNFFVDGDVSPVWHYVGCYSDSPTNRTLPDLQISFIAFLDVPICAHLCEQEADVAIFALHPTANTFFAGIENGGQCWCGPTVASTSQRLPDIACESQGCQLNNSLACGGVNAMALYEYILVEPLGGETNNCGVDKASELPGNRQFLLDAVFLDNLSERIPLSTVGLIHRTNNLPGIGPQANILSACDGSSNCPNPMVFGFPGNFLVPNVSLGTLLTDGPIYIPPIGTAHFIELQDLLFTFGDYCVQTSLHFPGQIALTALFSRPLPFNAPPNVVYDPVRPWALCANGTALGRLDVVYKQLLLVPGFNLTNCRDIELLVTFVE